MKHVNNRLNNPLWTALITPLTDSGRPDLEGLQRLLREQEEAGNGVLILGSTGESLNLDEEERKLIVRYTVSLKLDIPIMVGVGGHHLPGVASWLYFLESQKVDAYLMVTPIYSKPGPEGQYHWFKTLLDLVTRPVMLYNIPKRTGIALHLDAVSRLHTHKNFWAIKEASGSVDDFREYKAVCGDVQLYSGDDLMLPDFAPHGACGVVSVAGNVWPAATRLYSEMALAGELSEEDRTFWKRTSNELFVAPNPVPAKAVMHREGRIRTPNVKLPLHADDMNSLDRLIRLSEEVREWHGKRSHAGLSVS
ncbi:4-hydroxy-tetrahydrodipicolinate synthase [Balneolales bacterium ANBcel1]|nr:4-hydroxy-tetrahydrodipicolinate synthase [Balneolales bacterium ANBcel1]